MIERCFEERLTGPGGASYYAARLELIFAPSQHEIALRILARTSRFKGGVTRSELAVAASASDVGHVLQTLEADGYLGRRDDRLAFQSNLLRVWWRKHRSGAQ